MDDRDGLWQDTSESEDGDEENNNNVEDEAQDDIHNLQLQMISGNITQEHEPEQAVYDRRRIVPQEVHDEVVAENIESNQATDGDIIIVSEDIAVEIVGETAVVSDNTDEDTDDDMTGEGYQLPVINTATTAEVLGISSDSDAEYEASEDTIDVGESHSLPTPGPGSGTSSENTPGPSHSQPHSPISVFYQTTGILPHPATSSLSSKSVSRGKRFPWTSYNNFGFSSDSDDEIDVAARPREGGEWGGSRAVTLQPVSDVSAATTSHSAGPAEELSPRIPRIVSDPHDVWSFSRAANSLPASRPNFDQRRFLRQISMVESGEGDPVAANQEDPVGGAGSSSQPQPAGRISPAAGTSALARVIYNSGAVATNTSTPWREVPTITPLTPSCSHSRQSRMGQTPCTHTHRAYSSNTHSFNLTPSPQTSPTLVRHSCPHRSSAATVTPNPMFSQALPPLSIPSTAPTDVQSQADSRIRLARDFLRALSSPPIPSVPSLPNTTIRRILSVNTNELLGGDLTSPPTSPQTSMFGPLPLPPQVRTPRFEPQPGPSNATPAPGQNQEAVQGDGAREDQRIDRIDRILQLSRRTRVINDTIERSISRDLDNMRANPVPLTLMPSGRTATVASTVVGAETAREDVRRQAQRILAEMQQQRREDARRQEGVRRSLERAESVTLNYARERVERAAEDVSNEFVREAPNFVVAEPPAPKRARLEPSGQFEADIAEALKRSLADQPAEPQPGCSHWEAGAGQAETDAPQDVNEEATAGEAAVPKPPDNPGPNYEAMYRSLTTSHRKLVTELQSSLECPVCLDTIRTAPVQCCRNGHLICSLCITRTHICPTCRAPMTLQSGQRCVSHSANRLVDLLPHPCTNRDSGCEVEELLGTLTQHEQDCPYRLVRCPIGYCTDNIPMASLSEHVSAYPHFLTTHAYPTSNILTFSRYIPSQNMGQQNTFQLKSFDPIRFTFSGAIFYLQTITSPDKRFLYNFVQLEGTKEDCAKYWASITVASFNPYTASQVCQTVRPNPLDLHCRDDLQSIGEAIVMTEKVVVSVLQYDTVQARYQFKVKVKIMQSNEVVDQERQL